MHSVALCKAFQTICSDLSFASGQNLLFLLLQMIYVAYLKHNLLHFFVRALKLSDENDHDFSSVIVC